MKSILLLLFLSLVACTLPPKEVFNPDYDPEINIYGLISNDPDYEFVIVERTISLKEDYENLELQRSIFIDDARVFIMSSKDTVEFYFWKDESIHDQHHPEFTMARGVYLDRDNLLRTQAGEHYSLIVELSDGKIVQGETHVPMIPDIQSPKNTDVLNVNEIKQDSIVWAGRSETIAYMPQFIIKTSFDVDGLGYPYEMDLLYESNIQDLWTSLRPVYEYYQTENRKYFKPSATIKVMAVDQNLYDYTQKSGLAEVTGQSLSLVDGGLGVFGSMAVDSVRVRLIL